MTVFHTGSSAALHLLNHSVQALDKTSDFGVAINTTERSRKNNFTFLRGLRGIHVTASLRLSPVGQGGVRTLGPILFLQRAQGS